VVEIWRCIDTASKLASAGFTASGDNHVDLEHVVKSYWLDVVAPS